MGQCKISSYFYAKKNTKFIWYCFKCFTSRSLHIDIIYDLLCRFQIVNLSCVPIDKMIAFEHSSAEKFTTHLQSGNFFFDPFWCWTVQFGVQQSHFLFSALLVDIFNFIANVWIQMTNKRGQKELELDKMSNYWIKTKLKSTFRHFSIRVDSLFCPFQADRCVDRAGWHIQDVWIHFYHAFSNCSKCNCKSPIRCFIYGNEVDDNVKMFCWSVVEWMLWFWVIIMGWCYDILRHNIVNI